MANIHFDFEWIDPVGAKGLELRATWARLTITVDGKPITLSIDKTSQSVRTSVFLPLYPLAEWLATHWWNLLYEIETPGRRNAAEYWHRHTLSSASEGFALPALSIRPTGEHYHLSWRPIALHAQRTEFIGQGSAVLTKASLRRALEDFVLAVIARLDAQQIAPTLLHQEWQAVSSADREERAFCIASSKLGVDPYSLSKEEITAILALTDTLPASLLSEFLEVAAAFKLSEQVESVSSAIRFASRNPANLSPLRELRAGFVPDLKHGEPWEGGFAVARQLRQRLRLNGHIFNSFESIAAAFHVDGSALESAISVISDSPVFDALIDVNDEGSPGFSIGHQHAAAARFALCRCIFEYLVHRSSGPLLVTRARSDRQSWNRAFAAEFLAPIAEIQRRVHGVHIGEEELDELGITFGVSSFVIRHQLENHGMARVDSYRDGPVSTRRTG